MGFSFFLICPLGGGIRTLCHLRGQNYFFPMGTKLFELEGKTCKGTKWPTKAIVFCGCAQKCHMLNPETQVVHRDPRKPRISSYVIYHPPRNLDSLQSEWGDQFSLEGLRKVSTNKGRERIPPPGEGSDVQPSPLTKRQEGGVPEGPPFQRSAERGGQTFQYPLSRSARRGVPKGPPFKRSAERGSGSPITHPKVHNSIKTTEPTSFPHSESTNPPTYGSGNRRKGDTRI